MLTLKKHPDNVELCLLKTGKKKVPIFWHPVRNPELRNAVSEAVGTYISSTTQIENDELIEDLMWTSQ